MTKKYGIAAALSLYITVGLATANAAGVEAELQSAGNDVADLASLQRGAANFTNYCLGCHSAKYVRYSRLQEDLVLTEEQVKQNLMPAAKKLDEMMTIAMPAADAQRWFGQQPPDLSLVVRSRGADWVYTFLKSFYLDSEAPTGVNNLVLPNASMPHVLWELQGLQEGAFKDTVDEKTGESVSHFGEPQYFEEFIKVSDGKLPADDYDQFVRDIVNFLDWTATPEQLEREALGIWVLLFLLVFLIFAYFLKVEIWKDVK